ncbi:DUF1600 domain-containing protein [Mycoplasma tullyi]|uniref:DUF1600 domain-containing protein n=1 Tax=Mycoplasma tullyi TaxID=1612150 RepID=A0A7D7YKS5_9MOLU|nr:DUF1600 domain-containing protein [Mycoplasma tullyi]QMT98402.1 DUF1600 domain-containing protein [Mycoplasma tullyi]
MVNTKQRFCLRNWYHQTLTKSQRLFLTVFLFNIIGLGFVIYNFYSSIDINYFGSPFINGFTAIGNFTNQSSVLLFFFSFFFVFYPNNSVLKNERFLVFCMVYTLFTFFTGGIFKDLVDQANNRASFSQSYLASGIYLQIINPIVFIFAGYLRFIFNPIEKIQNYSKFILPGMIYPIIYLIYVLTIPLIYKTPDHTIYSVYGNYTNVVTNRNMAITVGMLMTFLYFPASFILIIFLIKKTNNHYFQIAQRKAKLNA